MKLHSTPLALAALLVASSLAAQARMRIDVKKAWLAPGRALDGASLVLENGKIRDVGSKESVQVQVDAKQRKTYANAVATAGFVDAHSHVGASGELSESAESMTPELRIRHSYDPFAKAWKRVLGRGITSAALAPDDKNLAGGIAATIKPGQLAPRDSDSFLKFSLTGPAFSRERRPTSLLGATDYLRETYESLKGAKPDELDATRTAIASTLGGGRNVGIAARSLREILAALEFIETYQLQAFLIHADYAADAVDRIQRLQLPVVLSPLSLASSRRARSLPKKLSEAGVRFAFGGETSDRNGMPRLQTSVALAVASGVDTGKALAAVTTVPAELAGVGDRAGSLLRGRDADVCIWSGDPWDLRSKLLLVVRGGQIVFEAE